jgi:hypothetical protein
MQLITPGTINRDFITGLQRQGFHLGTDDRQAQEPVVDFPDFALDEGPTREITSQWSNHFLMNWLPSMYQFQTLAGMLGQWPDSFRYIPQVVSSRFPRLEPGLSLKFRSLPRMEASASKVFSWDHLAFAGHCHPAFLRMAPPPRSITCCGPGTTRARFKLGSRSRRDLLPKSTNLPPSTGRISSYP